MNFVDSVKLTVTGGSGGKGCSSFRREKYVPFGGPDGGDGGRGGNVVVEGDKGVHTLLDLRYKRESKAPNGTHGKGSDMTGRCGEDLVIKVPFGTIILDEESGEVIADISATLPSVVVARGGRGGRGNAAFVSSTQRAPRICEPGEAGESKMLRFELKLLADIGIIGYPNAGKSTFISVVSAARPKVADYPFTTLAPVLGVVKNDYGDAYVLADMPGLIEGASEGVGLGLRFLRHIERTTLLFHFVDASEESSMIDRYKSIRAELKNYSDEVAAKEEVVVATKADSAIVDNLEEFKQFIEGEGRRFFIISSLSKEGVTELLQWTNQLFRKKAEE